MHIYNIYIYKYTVGEKKAFIFLFKNNLIFALVVGKELEQVVPIFQEKSSIVLNQSRHDTSFHSQREFKILSDRMCSVLNTVLVW